MMANSEIVEILELTSKLLDLHDVDEIRVKTYGNAAYNLDKFAGDLASMSFGELITLQGVGKMMAGKIQEIVQKGELAELNELLAKTPEGVLDFFKIKGLGVKKIKTIWQESGLDNINDLLIACQNGEIANIKGFGDKMQAQIVESIEFLQAQIGKLRMNKAEALANIILEQLRPHFAKIVVSGEVARKCETVGKIQFLATQNPLLTSPDGGGTTPSLFGEGCGGVLGVWKSAFRWEGFYEGYKIPIEIQLVEAESLVNKQFIYGANENHLKIRNDAGKTLLQIASEKNYTDEKSIYEKANLPYIIPEMREGRNEFEWAKKHEIEDLITWDSLKGILHNHSTYSDGKHSLKQMADFCKELGFEYLGIADHSQSATYAKGLLPTKVMQQWKEIDELNEGYKAMSDERGVMSENLSQQPTANSRFRILKGIEADILGDGSLDYPDEILAGFDYVVASVHSNLGMNITKATDRLLRAIENPYTTILGHPTGRLLLSREGYPIDYKTIIDACANNKVVIELNASPYRLDLDWRWIDYCMEQGVKISINPDAHEMNGYFDMHYGVSIARKGGLTKNMTFNAIGLAEMEEYLKF